MDINFHKFDIPNITSTTEFDLNFKKYVKKNCFSAYNIDNLLDKDDNEDLECAICLNVLKNPVSCSDEKNCHYFCKECIDEYLKEKNECPTCKTNFEYKINNRLDNVLEKLNFKCFFQNEGCDYIMPYTEYLNHINNCKYNNSTYGCNVMKYNYTLKDFEKCGFIGDKLNIENHFKLCGYNKFRCLFCKHCV